MSSLAAQRFSIEHEQLASALAGSDNWLLIQDLDGVCMSLVRDPLTRQIEPDYVQAVRRLDGHFQVLTNGEHIGRCGVNPIIERALGSDTARAQGLYLPGLAAGGVQLQDRFGRVSHPGVSQAELDFLAAVPQRARDFLDQLLAAPPFALPAETRPALVAAAVLDNRVSPTINANVLYQAVDEDALCARLQQAVADWMNALLTEVASSDLADSFFVHYAPNLGRDAASGLERIKPAVAGNHGTTDFQFMLRGAIKEVGVLVLLNQHYARLTGEYPLGADFNARQAPHDHAELVALVQRHFDPALMPLLVGVGDTITSQPVEADGRLQVLRGGSDRGFLTLAQAIGAALGSDSAVVLIDSSGGELLRPQVNVSALQQPAGSPGWWQAVSGLSDPADPLQVNFVFPDGPAGYRRFIIELARRRR